MTTLEEFRERKHAKQAEPVDHTEDRPDEVKVRIYWTNPEYSLPSYPGQYLVTDGKSSKVATWNEGWEGVGEDFKIRYWTSINSASPYPRCKCGKYQGYLDYAIRGVYCDKCGERIGFEYWDALKVQK